MTNMSTTLPPRGGGSFWPLQMKEVADIIEVCTVAMQAIEEDQDPQCETVMRNNLERMRTVGDNDRCIADDCPTRPLMHLSNQYLANDDARREKQRASHENFASTANGEGACHGTLPVTHCWRDWLRSAPLP